MSMSDTLGDMLTRIRNGQMAHKDKIECPHSKLRANVCEVLKNEGFIRDYSVVEGEKNKRTMTIELKYEEGRGVIRQIDRVSKPGRRVYSAQKDLQHFYNGLGIYILSTPRGVIADHQARAANVGGEVLCQVF